jgi:PAS domain S-box-containing protein/putative nucleotidyltransferase with HDIG domain
MVVDFETLVRHSMDVVAVIDRNTELIYANPAAERVLGVAVSGEIGQPMSQHVHPDDLPAAMDGLAAITSGGRSGIPMSFRVHGRSGDWRVLQLVASSLLDDPGVRGIILNGRDVTDQVRTTQAFERGLERTIQTLASIVELRDRYTAGHQGRVAQLAEALAHKLDVDADTAKGITIAAALHDIGKIAVPAEILNKPGRISSAEFAVIKAHPDVGHDILSDIEFPWPVARMVLEHHERDDGSGYPNGVAGDQVLLGSRIIAVADVVEALSINRPYRASGGLADALAEISRGAGRRYDLAVSRACLQLFERDAFAFATTGAPDITDPAP